MTMKTKSQTPPMISLIFGLVLTLMAMPSVAEWHAVVNYNRGECSVINDSRSLVISHPTRFVKWQFGLIPNKVSFKGSKTFPANDVTYDWIITSLYGDSYHHEWVGLPNGLLVSVDATGFQTAWNKCLRAFPEDLKHPQ